MCRSFDQLNHGQGYDEIKPVIHIGILDHTMFADYPEFYAKYRFMNVNTHKIYNDKFALNVLDLKQIELATPEDKQYHIDQWALLFKSTTWEELKAMASLDDVFKEVGDTVFTLSADAQIQKRCRDREDYYADIRSMQKQIEEYKQQANDTQQQLDEERLRHEAELKAQADEIALLKKQIDELQKK